jgi:signal peptidase II
MLFYFLAFSILTIDQIIKLVVANSMALGQTIPLFGIVQLTYVRNTGAAFSLFSGFSPFLTVISIIVIIAVIYFHYKIPAKSTMLQIGLAYILGGSLGNLIDRLFRGYVIDYINFTFWPVFNFADIMINLGVLLIIIQIFIKERKGASNPV